MDKKAMNVAIKSKVIDNKRIVKLTKNDWQRVHAKCADRKYNWHLHVVRRVGESAY